MIAVIYLVCSQFELFGSDSENGYEVLFAFSNLDKANKRLKELNETIEIEEGDLPYILKYMNLE